MKRTVTFLLILSLLTGFALTAGAAASYTLPEALKTVPKKAEAISLPGGTPPYVRVKAFEIIGDGVIRLELGDAVPRLKILERNFMDGAESTIFTKKNTSSAEARITGEENSVFFVRMIWQLGGMEYIREYAARSGSLTFVRCTASAEPDPAGYEPYASVVRTLSFNESGGLTAETWTLENDKDRLIRTASFNGNGLLTSVKQTWESVVAGGYQFVAETDGDGNLIGLAAQDHKTLFYAESIRLDASPDDLMSFPAATLDSSAFDEQLARKYPQLARRLTGREAGGKETPIPANARIWALNFGDYIDPDVYAFITADPVLTLKNGRAVLNPGAKDVNGDAIRLKKNKVASPVLEIAGIE